MTCGDILKPYAGKESSSPFNVYRLCIKLCPTYVPQSFRWSCRDVNTCHKLTCGYGGCYFSIHLVCCVLNSSRMFVGAVIERETFATHSLGGSHYLGLEHSWTALANTLYALCFRDTILAVAWGFQERHYDHRGTSPCIYMDVCFGRNVHATFLQRFLVGAYAIFHFVVFLII